MQFRIATEVARRRGPALARAFPNVVAVGAGFRALSTTELPVDEVCLRFLVSRKWKRGHGRGSAIPRRIRASVTLRGRKLVLDIPTDVSEFRAGRPHATLDVTRGITTYAAHGPRDVGAACCLVRNAEQPGERYVLSCYHVFSPSLTELPGAIRCRVSPGGPAIGPLLEIADPDGPDVALDAALALVEDSAVTALSCHARRLTSRATDYDLSVLVDQTQLYVYARGGAGRRGPLDAFFQSLFPNPVAFDYRATAGRVLYFSDTLQYVAPVQPGDSGAAVADATGKLYGMHFYGEGNVGFALSAPRLFDYGVFPFDIELI